MSYLGRSVDAISNVEKLDNITFDGSSSYTLQKGGSNFVPSSANAILISIDGVVQSGNFTVSSSTIDFGVAIASTSTCNFILHLGVGLITSPSDGSVGTSQLASNAVTSAKMFSGFANGIAVADQFRLSASLSSTQDITANLERVDTSGQGGLTGSQMSESSGIFTFPSTGIYLVQFFSVVTCASGGDNVGIQILVTTNNSSYVTVARSFDRDHESGHGTCYCDSLIDVTDTSNVKVKFASLSIDSGSSLTGNTEYNQTAMTFIRMGDT